MAKQITGVLVTTEGEAKQVTIEDSLEGYYEALGCDIIDLTVRRIGKKEYDIVCDDEGLLKPDPVVTAITQRYQPALVGNLFICSNDGKGHWKSLTAKQIEEILMNTVMVFSNGKIREVVQIWA